MADKTVKHFVFSRFFPVQVQTYLYNVLALKFLKTQLPLAKNMLSSLENQTNKNFEMVFITNPEYFNAPKYELIFSTLRDSTVLPLRFIKFDDIPGLLKDAYNNYDFVIQTRMDFDDFVFKDAVAETQSKINEYNNILTYGYGKGYIYAQNELYTFLPAERIYLSNNDGYFSAFFSLILKSSFAKTLPVIDINKFDHTRVITRLKRFFEKNNIEFPEGVYQENISDYSFIYFRHKFSRENLAGKDKIKGKIPLTNEDGLTKKQLEEEFGFFYDLNSIK